MPRTAGATPFGTLRFLYVGTGKFEDDLRFYRDEVGAAVVWNLEGFGARVAALRIADGPLLLIADHRHAPSTMPVYEVADLKAVVKGLKARGCTPESGPFEIPNGPCCVFKDPSGNEFAIFEDVRPGVFDAESVKPRRTSRRTR
jgi:predicted enzyme related to lactoylglutathione lyase